MTNTSLISHRLFVSALGQHAQPPATERGETARQPDERVIEAQVELLPGWDASQPDLTRPSTLTAKPHP
jgi:hypothetical protein